MKSIGLLIMQFLLLGYSNCSPEEKALITSLLENYVKYARPAQTESEVVNVTLSMSLLFIENFDTFHGTVKAKVWLQMGWKDYQMQWDPKEYGGIEGLRLPPKLLWTPDIELYNSIAPAMALAETNLVVSYTGEIFWVPPTVVEFPCITDHAGEAYKCAAKMGSWAYDGFKVDLTTANFDLTDYAPSTLYEVSEPSAVRHVKYYPCCEEPYVDVEFSFDIKLR